jgi:NTE family protein
MSDTPDALSPTIMAVDSDLMKVLCESAEDVHVKAGDWLFHTGDVSTDIFVVKSGRLHVVREPTGEVLRVLSAGDLTGELAPLLTTARSAGIRAQRDSNLSRITAEDFLAKLRSDREATLHVATQLARIVQYSRPSVAQVPSAAGVVALVPCDVGARMNAARDRFEQLFAQAAPLRAIDHTSADERDTPGQILAALEADIAEAEEGGMHVVLHGRGDEQLTGSWNQYCARQADRVVLVADPTLPVPTVEDHFRRCDLVFVRVPAPEALTAWLDALEPRSHAVAIPEDRYFGLAPVVRRVLGRATGLVLAGGGARNFAHIGVIEELLDAGLAIDRIGGCSIGALAGALFALGVTPAEMREIFRREFVERTPLNRGIVGLATLPLRPFLRPGEERSIYGSLRHLFADLLLEELPKSMYTSTADLATGEIQTARRGPLWEAVAVSMTIPILFPPRASEGRLLVDGGILDAFPVSPMTAELDGPIIGVAGASSATAPVGQLESELVLTGSTDVAASLPSALETLLRVMDLVCYNSPGVRDGASVLITPDVGTTGITQFDRLDAMIEAGREAARRAMEDHDMSVFAKRFDGEPAQSGWLLDTLHARRGATTLTGRAASAVEVAVIRAIEQIGTLSAAAGIGLDSLHIPKPPSVSSVVDAALTKAIQQIPH